MAMGREMPGNRSQKRQSLDIQIPRGRQVEADRFDTRVDRGHNLPAHVLGGRGIQDFRKRDRGFDRVRRRWRFGVSRRFEWLSRGCRGRGDSRRRGSCRDDRSLSTSGEDGL